MQDLMRRIGFTQEEIREVLSFVRQLEEKQLLGEIWRLAEEIMEEHPCNIMLQRNLEKARNMETVSGIHKYSLEFVLLLKCALLLREDYQAKHYDLDLYYESMKDLTYKLQECKKMYGVVGNFVGFWYDGFFDMTRFAFGRLQFELMKISLEAPVEVHGHTIKDGDEVINMHIPSCGPLSRQETEKSFAMAREFYKDRFAGKPVVFLMESWLLDTDLICLLPEGNIQNFVKDFRVLRVAKHDIFHDGWRVFGPDWENKPEQLPRNTRLQKAIADYLQQGGRLGEGYGVIIP